MNWGILASMSEGGVSRVSERKSRWVEFSGGYSQSSEAQESLFSRQKDIGTLSLHLSFYLSLAVKHFAKFKRLCGSNGSPG
jgi:hypothetical protein